MTTKSNPVIAAKASAKVTLEAGKDYFLCRCGKSAIGGIPPYEELKQAA